MRGATQRRYGGKTADQRRAERRERLLDAGLELFGTVGYAATTVEAICSAAGLNPRYLYEQFSGREELLAAVYDRHVHSVLATVRHAIDAAPADPGQRLHAGLIAFVTATLADERAARVNYFEMVGVSAALEAQRRGVLSAYATLIAEEASNLLDAGPLTRGDRRGAAVALVGATDGLIIDWMSMPPAERPPAERIVDTLVAIFGRT